MKARWRTCPATASKPLLTIQSLTQLNRVYGEENNLWQRCAIRTVLPLNDFKTAAVVAEDIGIVARVGQADTEQRQQPITPDELMCLGKREAIILGAAAETHPCGRPTLLRGRGFPGACGGRQRRPVDVGHRGA